MTDDPVEEEEEEVATIIAREDTEVSKVLDTT
jgi:hypothetical protein